MSIQTQIDRIKSNLSGAYNVVSAKGGTLPKAQDSANLAAAVGSIPTGTDTSDATATAADILSGKTAYADGAKVTGTIPSQAAATITPGTAAKTAVEAGRYTTGAVTVAGDANLKAANIKSGVSIFGVAGSYTGTVTSFSRSTVTISKDSTISIVAATYPESTTTISAGKTTNFTTYGAFVLYVEPKSLRNTVKITVSGGISLVVDTGNADVIQTFGSQDYLILPTSSTVTVTITAASGFG